MTSGSQFSSTDRRDLELRGITLDEAQRQLELLAEPPPPLVLEGACKTDDGITVLDPGAWSKLEADWDTASRDLRVVKFVPASGAATRMFSFLAAGTEALGKNVDLPTLEQAARSGDETADQCLTLANRYDELPFAPALTSLAANRGIDLADLKRQPLRLGDLIAAPGGLDLGSLPKGLISFHSYPSRVSNAFEEHLAEALGYGRGRDDVVALHFTVASDHRRMFEDAARGAVKSFDPTSDIRFEIEFSVQAPSTDTLAVTTAGTLEPLRSGSGQLIFRPAGHGALLENLNRLEADVVFIKNIDNIARSEHHPATAAWKKRLGAHLVHLRRTSFALLDRLESTDPAADGDAATHAAREALAFCRESLALRVPESLATQAPEALKRFLLDQLDRPLRVCGVVANVGEPGGGPFWTTDAIRAFGESGQIVEKSQVDSTSAEQTEIFTSATHFNPVDLVCALRDREGKPYDLTRFTDPSASFVSEKKHHGRSIRVLERPGLWNGSMAQWNTAFVEVPLGTFTPVKTILDLLRPEHQPKA